METTAAVQTLTDELLGEIGDEIARGLESVDNTVIARMMNELRTLRAQVKALQSDANSWQSGYDEGRRMAGKHRLSEIEQLRAENASMAARIEEMSTPYSRTCERMWALEAENADLRKDAGRLDWLADLNSPAQVMLPSQCVLDNIHSMRDAIDTAMDQAK